MHLYRLITHEPGAHRGQKRALDNLELELTKGCELQCGWQESNLFLCKSRSALNQRAVSLAPFNIIFIFLESRPIKQGKSFPSFGKIYKTGMCLAFRSVEY